MAVPSGAGIGRVSGLDTFREPGAVPPNAARRAPAPPGRAWPVRVLGVTRNVDDPRGRAGSRALLRMHGALRRVRRPSCGAPARHPDLAWFGGMPPHMPAIGHGLATCELFVATGTRGPAYPAAGFAAGVGRRPRTIELDLRSFVGGAFNGHRAGPATRLVPVLGAELPAA